MKLHETQPHPKTNIMKTKKHLDRNPSLSPPPSVATVMAKKLPALVPLKNRSKEEQIRRYTSRLSSFPLAVDTLLVGMRGIRDDPSDPKYRTIDKATTGYQTTLAPVATTVEGLLNAVGFENHHETNRRRHLMVLKPHQTSKTHLVEIAIRALETTRKSKVYITEKKKLQFLKQVRSIINNSSSSKRCIKEEGRSPSLVTTVSQGEMDARSAYAKKMSPDPSGNDGNVTVIRVELLPELTVKRRFYGDDQFRDVLFWLGSLASEIPTHLLEGNWCLMDTIVSDPVPILCSNNNLNMTLERIGMWPNGRLQLSQTDIGKATESIFVPRGLGITASA